MTDTLHEEINWFELPFYEVTEDGEIISHMNWNGKGSRALRKRHNKDGYFTVNLNFGQKRKMLPVHRLVAYHYLPPRPSEQHVIRHLNGVRTDNRASNLSWGLPRENSEDRERHGNTARGERSGASKLTEKEVVAIRSFDHSIPHAVVARKFSISDVQVRNIRTKKSWRHV